MIYFLLWYQKAYWLIPAECEFWAMLLRQNHRTPSSSTHRFKWNSMDHFKEKRCTFTGNMCGVWGLQWSRTFKNTHCIFWITDHTTFLHVNNSAFFEFNISPNPQTLKLWRTGEDLKARLESCKHSKKRVSFQRVHQAAEDIATNFKVLSMLP